jgi:hypothetical protein
MIQTIKLPFILMSPQMIIFVPFRGKLFTTYFALIWLIVLMKTHVNIKVPSFCEILVAINALMTSNVLMSSINVLYNILFPS